MRDAPTSPLSLYSCVRSKAISRVPKAVRARHGAQSRQTIPHTHTYAPSHPHTQRYAPTHVHQCFLAALMFKATEDFKLCCFTGRPAETRLLEPTPNFLRATAVGWQPMIGPWRLAARLNVAALLLDRLPDFPNVW